MACEVQEIISVESNYNSRISRLQGIKKKTKQEALWCWFSAVGFFVASVALVLLSLAAINEMYVALLVLGVVSFILFAYQVISGIICSKEIYKLNREIENIALDKIEIDKEKQTQEMEEIKSEEAETLSPENSNRKVRFSDKVEMFSENKEKEEKKEEDEGNEKETEFDEERLAVQSLRS